MKNFYKTLLSFLFVALCFAAAQAQTGSGQAKFISPTPTVLSGCNQDSVAIQITNLNGPVCPDPLSLTNLATISVDIPGGTIVDYVASSLSSNATFVSYASKKLTFTVSMPPYGQSKVIKFLVFSNCTVNTLSSLPIFNAQISYPTSYGTPSSETFDSGVLNVGVAQISHSFWSDAWGNPNPAFNTQFRIISQTQNVGYGSTKEVYYYTVNDKALTFNSMYVYAISTAGVYSYIANVITPISTTSYDANHTLRVYKITGMTLGSDALFTPGETLRFDEYLTPPSLCTQYKGTRWWEIKCSGQTSCQKSDTLHSTVNLAAGTPKLDGTLITAEVPDGCPLKHISYSIKNNGVGNAAPVGNAYDVDLNVSFGGGLMTISNLKLNGIAVPAINIVPSSSASSNFKISLKDFMTTDPDGAGGISDIDGDGFFDDMLVGAQVTVDFDYTIPCNLACGANLFYQLSSNNTFTDYCRTLKGVTNTALTNFGFQQVQAITQTRKVDYGTIATGSSVSDTAKFNFQYKAYNINLASATTQLRINYSKRMEVDLSSIRLNNVPFTNTPTIVGSNSIGAPPDNDSMIVVNLTNAEMLTLFDASPDSLRYIQTAYGCTDRQVQRNGDNWQLVISLQSGLCTDGSTPCNFDLACKKGYVYSVTNSCGSKPCYQNKASFYRESPLGWTDTSETTHIAVEDSTRAWVGDTVVFKGTAFMNGFGRMEPFGYWTNQGTNQAFKDGRFLFSLQYSKSKGWHGPQSPFTFLPGISEIIVHKYTPHPTNKNLLGTIGPIVAIAPLQINDFYTDGSATWASTQNNFQGNYVPYGGTYGSVYGGSGWYCLNAASSWHIHDLCPIKDGYWNSSTAIGDIAANRYENATETKFNENYYIGWGKALARAGWTANPGDTAYYYEVKTRWVVNKDFPWDNSNDFNFQGAFEHLGNYQTVNYNDLVNSTYFGACQNFTALGLAVTKNVYVSNPNSVYSANCGLTVHHKVFFNSFEGNYFRNNEVRVPYQIDSIVVKLPTEYQISSGTLGLDYYQSCSLQNSTSFTASASTGHVVFTNSAGAFFPRTDDCGGNKNVYDFHYTLYKAGTAAPAIYHFPITIYGKDEFGKVIALADSGAISEANPILTLTPVTAVQNNTDGGACTPAYFDFKIQNNTLFDAPNTYFATESSAGTVMYNVTDGDNVYPDPIINSDTSHYAGTNIFVKLGTIKAGDIRIVRVYANTNICSDNFTVYADWGCNYPSPLKPDMASATLKTTTASYIAATPNILSLPVGGSLSVVDLCTNKTVEVEVKNSNLANLYNILASYKLPANATYVASTAQIAVKKLIGGASDPTTWTYAALPSGSVTSVSADSLVLNLSAAAPLNRICGLPGSDESPSNVLRVKFDIKFNACPTNATETILYKIAGQNYCGTPTSTRGALNINYVGTTGVPNNYVCTMSSTPFYLCVAPGAAQVLQDTLLVKNTGGYTASGASSGADSILITVPVDASIMTISNISVGTPFSGAIFGTSTQGFTTIKVAIPSGVAVGSTISMPLTYSITPKSTTSCSALSAGNCSVLSFSYAVTTSINLGCASKGLACTSLSKVARGNGINPRTFSCCGTIGNYVWRDDNSDGLQNEAAANGINGVKVYLYKETTAGSGVYAVVDSTTTANDGSGNAGYYNFTGIVNANYKVKFPTTVGTYPLSTPNNQAATTDGNNDANSTGFSGVIAMNPALGGLKKDNPTIDAGYVCTKPNAGIDQNPTCVGYTPITTATLSATAVSGGVWTQVSTNPTGAVIASSSSANSGVSGLNAGIYQFVWSVGSCSDTVKITIPSCVCSLSLTAVPSACTPATNTYSVSGNLTFTNAPTTGTLTVSIGAVSQVFNAPFTTNQAYTLAGGFLSDGLSHTVTAVFSGVSSCSNTKSFIAPIGCCPTKNCGGVGVKKN